MKVKKLFTLELSNSTICIVFFIGINVCVGNFQIVTRTTLR